MSARRSAVKRDAVCSTYHPRLICSSGVPFHIFVFHEPLCVRACGGQDLGRQQIYHAADNMREESQHLEIVNDEAGSSGNRSECAESIGRVLNHALSVEWLEDLVDTTILMYRQLHLHVPAQIPAHPTEKLGSSKSFDGFVPMPKEPGVICGRTVGMGPRFPGNTGSGS